MNDDRFDPHNALTRDGGSRAEVAEINSEDDPEHFAPIASRVLDDLAARRRVALDRLSRQHRGRTREETR